MITCVSEGLQIVSLLNTFMYLLTFNLCNVLTILFVMCFFFTCFIYIYIRIFHLFFKNAKRVVYSRMPHGLFHTVNANGDYGCQARYSVNNSLHFSIFFKQSYHISFKKLYAPLVVLSELLLKNLFSKCSKRTCSIICYILCFWRN